MVAFEQRQASPLEQNVFMHHINTQYTLHQKMK